MKPCAPKPGFTITLLGLSLFLILLMSPAGPASACNGSGCSCQVGGCSATYPCGDPCPCINNNELQAGDFVDVPLGETILTPVAGNRSLIKISGFQSFGMFAADDCVLALGAVDGIDHIRSVRILDGDSGALLRELPFQANAASGSSFAVEAVTHNLAREGAAWQGFFGEVLGDVSRGRMLTFVLDARLKKGVSLGLLAEQLSLAGLLGTAAANGDGTVNHEHVHFRVLGDTPISILPPAERSRPETRPRP